MIIVFGSINADGVMQTHRLPMAGETRLDGKYAIYPGGKGANQALAAARAGAEVAFIGCVGNDGLADVALSGLREANIDLTRVTSVAEVATGYASVMVNEQGENAITVASGANQQVRASQLPEYLDAKTTLVLQAEVPMRENLLAARRAKAAGGNTILNLAPYQSPDPALLEATDMLIVNEVEARQLATDRAGTRSDADDLLASAGALHDELATVVVLTLGAKGVVAFDAGEMSCYPALSITPTDTTGAGDAFVGCLAAALDAGDSLPVALRRSVIGGALACLKLGAQTALPSKNEIDAAYAKGRAD